MTENELYHHGILGQKWGVRRYQNEDGTLTEVGKKRYLGGIQKDIDSFKPYAKTGIVSKSGRVVVSPKDVNDTVNALEEVKRRTERKAIKNLNRRRAVEDKITNAANKLKDPEFKKKAFKVGLAVAGTALAAYGAYKVGSVIKSNNSASMRKAEEMVRSMFEENIGLSKTDRIPGTGLYINRNSPEPDYDTFKPDTFKPDTFKPDTFKPDTFQESILRARRNGVPENEILKTKKDIDDYFNPQTIGDTAGNMLRARDRGDSIADYMNSKQAKADSAYSKARHKATQDFIKSVENARSAGVPEDQIIKTVSEADDYFTIGKKNRDKK